MSQLSVRAAAAVLGMSVLGCSPAVAGPTVTVGPSSSPTTTATGSPAPSASPTATAAVVAAVPHPPVEFTGRIACGRPVTVSGNGIEETIELEDGEMVLTKNRGGAWRQSIAVDDPRLEGDIYHTYESDTYSLPGAEIGAQVFAATYRIENEAGAWESRSLGARYDDGTPVGDGLMVFVGQGAYEGLTAIAQGTPSPDNACAQNIRGLIFEGGPVPEPYVP